MIIDWQVWWLIGSLACGIYASTQLARYKYTVIRKRPSRRIQISVGTFLTAWFMVLLVLSVLTG